MAQDFTADRQAFTQALQEESGPDGASADDAGVIDNAAATSSVDFSAYVESNPQRTCAQELSQAIAASLGVAVEGFSAQVTSETVTQMGTQLHDSSSFELRISYPGLQGLSLGPMDYVQEQGRWKCTVQVPEQGLQVAKNYLSLSRLKTNRRHSKTSAERGIAMARTIGVRLRALGRDALAVDADILADDLEVVMARLRIEAGDIKVQVICDPCSDGKLCDRAVNGLKAANVTLLPTIHQPIDRALVYFRYDESKRILDQVLAAFRFPFIQIPSAGRDDHDAIVLVQDWRVAFKRQLAGFFPSICAHPTEPPLSWRPHLIQSAQAAETIDGTSEGRDAYITNPNKANTKPMMVGAPQAVAGRDFALVTADGHLAAIKKGSPLWVIRRTIKQQRILVVINRESPMVGYVGQGDINGFSALGPFAPQMTLLRPTVLEVGQQPARMTLRPGTRVFLIQSAGDRCLILGPRKWVVGTVDCAGIGPISQGDQK